MNFQQNFLYCKIYIQKTESKNWKNVSNSAYASTSLIHADHAHRASLKARTAHHTCAADESGGGFQDSILTVIKMHIMLSEMVVNIFMPETNSGEGVGDKRGVCDPKLF